MKEKSIYWGYETLFKRQQALLDKENISDNNKELIRQFQDHLFTTGTKSQRVAKLTWNLRKICRLLEKNLSEATKKDIERIVSNIQTDEKYTDNTKSDYKRGLKSFYKWYEDEDKRIIKGSQTEREEALRMYKYLKKYVKTSTKTPPVDSGSIITDKEIEIVIEKGCKRDMERVFIKLLHETGCRIGELLGIRLKDIQQKEHNWIIRLDGKTGERPRPVLDSIPYILRWLDFHPDKENPDAYLFISIEGRWKGKRIQYWGARRIIERCFERAEITKKHNPHWFRHSRATIDAPKYVDSIQCQIMGWSQGSRQVARYRHMSGQQTEEAFLKARGVKRIDEVSNDPQPIKCFCGRLNEPQAKYCNICGKALNVEVVIKEQDYMNKVFELMNQMMNKPELRDQFEEWKAKS